MRAPLLLALTVAGLALTAGGSARAQSASEPTPPALRLSAQAGAGALGFTLPTLACGLALDPSEDDFAMTGVLLYACGLVSAGATTLATYFTGEALDGASGLGWTMLGTTTGVVIGGLIALPLGLLDIITGAKEDTALLLATVTIVGLATVGGSLAAYELANEAR